MAPLLRSGSELSPPSVLAGCLFLTGLTIFLPFCEPKKTILGL